MVGFSQPWVGLTIEWPQLVQASARIGTLSLAARMRWTGQHADEIFIKGVTVEHNRRWVPPSSARNYSTTSLETYPSKKR